MLDAAGDVLVPDPMVAAELNVSYMTLWRWGRDQTLAFPPAIKIRNRNYRSRRALEAWKRRMADQSSLPAEGQAA